MSKKEEQIEKAGGLIVRELKKGKKEVYVVHRKRYDDWSLPKGHIDAGETPMQAALREVAEEAHMMCTVVRALPPHFYTSNDGQESIVHYFEMNMIADGLDVHDDEVDKGEWMSVKKAVETVSYDSLKEYLKEVM